MPHIVSVTGEEAVMRIKAAVPLSFFVMAWSYAAQSDPLTEFYNTMQKDFEKQHLIPIVIPRGETVGNVYNIRNLQFVADSKTCFPRLVLPTTQESDLPTLTTSNDINGALAAGLTNVATAQAQLGKADGVTMEFTDVTVLSAPALTLVSAFDPNSCKFLQAEVEATRNGTPYSGDASYLVVGEVMYAKRNLSFTYKDSGKASVELSNWQKFLALTGLTASASINADAQSTVVVVTKNPLPVAIRPAFVPDSFPVSIRGNNSLNWMPLDSHDKEINEQLDDLSVNLIKSLPDVNKINGF
jgi:hypothetical protein